MPHITVIRHSLTEADEQGLLMGSVLDSPLSAKGIDLARRKGLTLKSSGYKPSKVFSSQLIRTKQTADTILETLDLDLEVVELDWLNERDFGRYDGRPLQELLDGFNEHGFNPPTVETVDHFVGRIVRGLEQLKQDTSANILVVTHSNTINVMKAAMLNPEKLSRFWETEVPEYCEGFSYA